MNAVPRFFQIVLKNFPLLPEQIVLTKVKREPFDSKSAEKFERKMRHLAKKKFLGPML